MSSISCAASTDEPAQQHDPVWQSSVARGLAPRCVLSIDMFAIPTISFRLLYGFLVLRHSPPPTPL
jgi:hypothetical protein